MRNRKKGTIYILTTLITLILILLGVCAVCLKQINNMGVKQQEAEELISKLEDVADENVILKKELDILTDPGNGVTAHGQLSVQGRHLISENGEIVQLRGISSHGLNWYPKYTNASAMATLKEYGANVFRIAMYSAQNGSYIEEPEQNKTYMYMAVENVLSQDMYAIIDWHILKDENPLVYLDEAKEFFEEISSYYAGNKGIIYEICNEPNGNTTWKDVVEYANIIIPIIRSNSPDAVIIVGTPNFCTDLESAMSDPLIYDNIMYSYHKYIDATVEEELGIEQLKKAIREDFPVFVSEWGIDYEEGTELLDFDTAYAFVAGMRQYDISWCVWALSNKGEPHSILKEDCDKISGWSEEDFSDAGEFIIKMLK